MTSNKPLPASLMNKGLALLSISQLERILPMHRKTVERLVRSGKLPALRLNNRIFVRECDLNAYLGSCIMSKPKAVK